MIPFNKEDWIPLYGSVRYQISSGIIMIGTCKVTLDSLRNIVQLAEKFKFNYIDKEDEKKLLND